jgi:hypothetical protein
MSDDTKAPNMPETIPRTVDKPKPVEPCTNAAKASMTGYEASKMAGTRTDLPEVARKITKKEDVTKTAVRQTKGECDPESNFPSSGSRQRFVKPPDKLPLPTTASDRRVQCAQPIKTRKPDKIEQGEYDTFYESTANDKNGHITHFNAEDEVTFKFLLFVSNSQTPKKFNKYGQSAENIKLYVGRVSFNDDIKGDVDSDDLPLNVYRLKKDQRRQLKTIVAEEDTGVRQDDGVHDDQLQKFTLTTNPVTTTCLSIAVEEQNHGFKAWLIQVEDYLWAEMSCMVDKAYNGDVSKLFGKAYERHCQLCTTN